MRSGQPVPPMPMASDLTDVIFAGIQQPFESHYFEQGTQFLLWALLHPLPDGDRPATLGAVAKRLSDRDALGREIEAITPETGAAYHRLGLRVKNSRTAYKSFEVMVDMVTEAVTDYIALPSVRTDTAATELPQMRQGSPLSIAIEDDIPF